MIDLLACIATVLVGQTAPPPSANVAPVASPADLSWTNLLEHADSAFESRFAVSLKHQLQAARRAAGDVAGPWEELSVNAGADLDMQGNAAAEVSLSAMVGHRFGRRSEMGRTVHSARGSVLRSRQAAKRLTFRVNAVRAYAAWWEAASELEHVTEARDAQARYHARLKALPSGQLVPAATVTEVVGELAVLEGQVVDAKVRSDQARRELMALLGSSVRSGTLAAALAHTPKKGNREPWRTPQINPWSQHMGSSSLHSHPALEALRREAVLARAQSEAHGQQDAPLLSFGAGVRQVGGENTYGLLLLSGSFGLSGKGKSEAHVARGEAAALTERVERRKERLRRWFKAEHAQWPRLIAQRTALLTKVEAPLTERVSTMRKAVSKGLATEDVLIRARRDLHVAHHQRLAVEAALWASHARANALALATTSTPVRR